MSQPQSRIANSTEAVRRTAESERVRVEKYIATCAVKRDQDREFLVRWRNGGKEAAFARYAPPAKQLPAAALTTRAAVGKFPYDHRTCAEVFPSGVPCAGSAPLPSPGATDDGEGRAGVCPSPSVS